MEDVIKRFLAVGYGSGFGDGYGCGYGDGSGDGYGDGCGNGYGDGCGNGYGRGNGRGYGFGDGNGRGYGFGDGNGRGYGFGDGNGNGRGYGINRFNGKDVYIIDDIQTIVTSVHGNYAKGYILQSDLTFKPCYIARCGDCFAHGDTLADAVRDAAAKALENEPIEQRIERFKAVYPSADTIVANADLYKWHNVLTSSCEFGRKQFAKEHNIDIDNGSMSIREFIQLTKSAFGGEVIRQLKAEYNISK